VGALTNSASSRRGLGGLSRVDIAARISKSREALLGIMRHLGHSHVSAYERENLDVLEQQALLSAQFYVDTWLGGEKPHVIDVLCMAVVKADLNASLVHGILGGASLEMELTAPVEATLKREGLRVKREVPVGGGRADLAGYTTELWVRKIVLIELKNTPEQCERLAAQVAVYRRAADIVRVIMTPECLVKVSLSRDELVSPRAYWNVVSKMGAELWIYDTTAERLERLSEGSLGYSENEYDKLWSELDKGETA
jgi:hypothetical protein